MRKWPAKLLKDHWLEVKARDSLTRRSPSRAIAPDVAMGMVMGVVIDYQLGRPTSTAHFWDASEPCISQQSTTTPFASGTP